MSRYLWIVRFALGAAFTVIAALTIVPLPPGLLAVCVGIVMLGLLLWSEIEYRYRSISIPPEHADTLRRIAGTIAEDFHARRTIQFAGDKFHSANLRQSFRAHFPPYAKQLDKWDALVHAYEQSVAALSSKARATAEEHGLYPGAAAAFEQDALSLAQIGRSTEFTFTIATENLLNGVSAWIEVGSIRELRTQLSKWADTLGPEAARINQSYDLKVARQCIVCPKR